MARRRRRSHNLNTRRESPASAIVDVLSIIPDAVDGVLSLLQGNAKRPGPERELQINGIFQRGVDGEKLVGKIDAALKSLSSGHSVNRSQFIDELRNPEVMQALISRMSTETRSQGILAQTAWLETTFNRAAARGQTIRETISGSYFPTRNPGRLSNAAAEKLIWAVVNNGYDISHGSTGNACGRVGFGGNKTLAFYGGEKYGLENDSRDKKWREKVYGGQPDDSPSGNLYAENKKLLEATYRGDLEKLGRGTSGRKPYRLLLTDSGGLDVKELQRELHVRPDGKVDPRTLQGDSKNRTHQWVTAAANQILWMDHPQWRTRDGSYALGCLGRD